MTTLADLVTAAQQSAPVPRAVPVASSSPGTGILGWLGNLVNDAKATVTGLGGVTEQVVHDVGRGIAQAIDPIVPGHGVAFGPINNVDPTGYHLDNLLSALPSAIAHDYATRYGSVGAIGHGLYTHPLSYLLDALGVGSAIGKGAEAIGAGAIEGSDAARLAAQTAADALKDPLYGGGLTAKVANPAGIKAGLEQLATERPLSTLEQAAHDLLPSATARRVGDTVLPFAEKNNPVERALYAPIRRFTTEPISVLQSKAASLGGEIKSLQGASQEVPGALVAEYGKTQDMLNAAAKVDLSRLQKPFYAEKTLWLRGHGALSAASAADIAQREQDLAEVVRTQKPLYAEDPLYGAKMKGVPDGLNIDLQGPSAGPTAPWFTPDRVGSQVRTVPLVSGTVKTALSPDLSPEIRAIAEKANPAMLTSVDAAAQHVKSWLQDISANPAHMPEGTDFATLENDAQRYLSNRYDAVRRMVDQVRTDSGITHDITTRGTDAMRQLASNREMAGLGKGDSITHIMERTYRPLQFKYGGQIVDGQMVGAPDWRAIDDSLRAANVPAPVYFPYIPDSARKNWFEYLTNRSRIGARKATADPHLKFFSGNALESGTYITDPMEALSRRAIRYNRAQSVQNFIDYVVKPAGRRISSVDERTAGEGLFAPDGTYRLIRQTTSLQDTVDHLTSAGVDPNGLADALGHFLFKNHQELTTTIPVTKGMELYAIPNTLVRQIDNYARATGLFSSPGVRIFWDGPASAWRAFVLQGSPRWILNNTLGNTVMQKLTGFGSIRDVIQIAEERWKNWLNEKYGTHLDTSTLDLMQQVPGMARASSGGFASTENLYNPKLGSAAEGSRMADIGRGISQSPPVEWARKYGDANLRFNGAVEDVYRQSTYLSALEKQSITSAAHPIARQFWSLKTRIEKLISQSGEITDSQISAALTDLKNTLGNFGSLGPVERNVIRRFIAPFWGFYKHQGSMLARLPIDNPIRADVIRLLGQTNNEMLQQYGPIPDWLGGSVPLGPPGPTVSFLSSRGPNPFNASFQDPLSMLNPVLQIIASRGLGQNLFTGQQFQGSPHDYFTPFGSSQTYRYVRDSNGKIVNAVPVQGHVEPALLDQILGQIPQYSAIKGALAGGKTYDTTTLLNVLRAKLGMGSMSDLVQPGTASSPLDQLLKLAGIGTTPYALGKYQAALAAGQQQALNAAPGP